MGQGWHIYIFKRMASGIPPGIIWGGHKSLGRSADFKIHEATCYVNLAGAQLEPCKHTQIHSKESINAINGTVGGGRGCCIHMASQIKSEGICLSRESKMAPLPACITHGTEAEGRLQEHAIPETRASSNSNSVAPTANWYLNLTQAYLCFPKTTKLPKRIKK